MKYVMISLLGLLSVCGVRAQSVSGCVKDKTGAPVSFANIVSLSLPDSAFVEGTITDIDGRFSLPARGDLLRISCLGYTTVCYLLGSMPSEIVIDETSQQLGEVVVSGRRPAHKLTAEGLRTEVAGTALGRLGTADDVLAHLPGVQGKDGTYTVFGKGTPLVYINGKPLRDASELDQLRSEDIRHVELITRPGAKYDASVKAVIRITTKAPVGEGWGLDVRSGYGQGERADWTEQLNWKFRRGKIDLFGTLYYRRTKERTQTLLEQTVRADTLWRQTNDQWDLDENDRLTHIAGLNIALSEHHSIGVRHTLKDSPRSRAYSRFSTTMTADGAPYDRLETTSEEQTKARPAHALNLYYEGTTGAFTIGFNADYVHNRSRSETWNDEQSEQFVDRWVTSVGRVRNDLWAARLLATTPLFGGELTLGAEYSSVDRSDAYANPEGYVATLAASLSESHAAPFAEYVRELPFGLLTVGGRYEWVDFEYGEDGRRIDEQSRSFGNFFPSVSLGTEWRGVQAQLGYSVKTRRPSYQQLSNNVVYGNRFTFQSGNPRLEHEVVHNLGLAASWRFVQLGVDYDDRRHAILYQGTQIPGNENATLISFTNIRSLKSLMALLSLSPKLGIWSAEAAFGVRKQWLELPTSTGLLRLRTPILTGSLTNTFDFRKGWLLVVDCSLQGKGDVENCTNRTRVAFL